MSIIDVTAATVDRDDPMHYDRMCELANRLRGEYVARGRAAADDSEREHYRHLEREVSREADAVDGYDFDAVMRAAASFRKRLGKLDVAA